MKFITNLQRFLFFTIYIFSLGTIFSASVSFSQVLKDEINDFQKNADLSFSSNISFSVDNGNNKGFIYQNPKDRKDVKGYLFIPVIVNSFVSNDSAKMRMSEGFIKLAEVVQSSTSLNVTIDNIVNLDSPVLLKYPLACIDFKNNEISEAEKRNLNSYLTGGGFVIIDCYWEKWVKSFLGENVTYKGVPHDNPLYNCFYDITGERIEFSGIWMGEKLVGLFGFSLGEMGKNAITMEKDREYAVNIIVYSLIRNNKY